MQRWHERIGHFVYEWLLARNGHPSRDHIAQITLRVQLRYYISYIMALDYWKSFGFYY